MTSDCPATYSVGKNENNDSVISYNLSITCLNIKATFASYTFSGYDIGFTDIPYQYTVPSYVINTDYFELAKQSYDRNGGKQGLNKPTSSAEKLEGIKSLKAVIASGKKQAKGLKPILTKTKSITSAKKKTYFSTIRDFKSYAKNADTQISQLEALPYDDNFKSKATFFILRL